MTAITEKVWENVMDILSPEIDQNSFETWFKPVRFHSFNHDILQLTVPTDLYRKWLISNYYERILQAVAQITGCSPEIKFRTPEPDADEIESSKDCMISGNGADRLENASFNKPIASVLNERYTFANFVVGESNRFAHAAAKSVADPITRSYNPLFIYGGTGLGKTHLMQAIGHEIHRVKPESLVLYVTSEQFMNDFIKAIAQDNQYDFRRYYRNFWMTFNSSPARNTLRHNFSTHSTRFMTRGKRLSFRATDRQKNWSPLRSASVQDLSGG